MREEAVGGVEAVRQQIADYLFVTAVWCDWLEEQWIDPRVYRDRLVLAHTAEPRGWFDRCTYSHYRASVNTLPTHDGDGFGDGDIGNSRFGHRDGAYRGGDGHGMGLDSIADICGGGCGDGIDRDHDSPDHRGDGWSTGSLTGRHWEDG